LLPDSLLIDQRPPCLPGGVDELFASQTSELLARPEDPEHAPRLIALVEQAGHAARPAVDEPPGTVAVDADAAWAADLNRLAAASGITLVHLSERPRRLEEAFFAVTGSGDVPGGAR